MNNKDSEILGSAVIHRMYYAPHSNDKTLPEAPTIVPSRSIADIVMIPDHANFLVFEDVVETKIQVGTRTETVYSNPTNDTLYFIFREKPTRVDGWDEMEVHPSLRGKIWIYHRRANLTERHAA